MVEPKHCRIVEKKRPTLGAKLETAAPQPAALPPASTELSGTQDSVSSSIEAAPAEESVFEVFAIPDFFLGRFLSIVHADSFAEAYDRWVDEGRPLPERESAWSLTELPRNKEGIQLIDIRRKGVFLGWVADRQYALLLEEQMQKSDIVARANAEAPPSPRATRGPRAR